LWHILTKGSRVISGAFLGLLNNRAMRSRCSGVGSFSKKKILSYGVSGVIARASGLAVDSRLGLLSPTYGSYGSISVSTFTGIKGDCYDRFVVRSKEMLESFLIISQLLPVLTSIIGSSLRNANVNKRSKFVSMESVISHFKSSSSSLTINPAISVSSVEGPKGFIGVFLVDTGSVAPYRLHVRSPVAHNLHLLSTASNGYTFADFVATFCSLDVVLGEIDR
jgi:NADH-quinone oxidoreductase subunit D